MTMMMMNGSDQSETTSLAHSWPSSPKRSVPAYYVQSPSRESHEEDKSSNQGTTPSIDSPTESRSSSASRVSGTVRVKGSALKAGGEHDRHWRVIEEDEEEEVEGGSGSDDQMRRRHVWWVGLTGFFVVVCLFCLIIWGASRPFSPHVSLEKLIVNDFFAGHGSDWRGVPTRMLTVKCSLKMRVHNPATFFGIHISSTSINLLYYDLTVASGQMKEYYQPRKSWRDVIVGIEGNKIPLYGASTGFATAYGTRGVPLKLEFEFQTRGDVVGKLVRSKHRLSVSCSFTINPNNPKSVGFMENSCRYH